MDMATSPGAQVRVLRTLAEVEEIRSAWESWPGYRDSDIDVFLTLVRSNPNTLQPHVIVVYRGGRADAILVGRIDLTTLPVRLAYWTLLAPKVRLLTFVLGAQRGDSSPEVSELLLKEALASLRRGEADLGRLEFVRVDSVLWCLARTLPGRFGRDWIVDPQPHWRTELSKPYEEVLEGLSRHLRKWLRQTAKRIQADFESVDVRCFQRPDEVDAMLADIEHIASKSYQRRIGVGFHNTEHMRRLLLFQAEKGWLRASVLYLRAKPAAFFFGSLYNSVFYVDEMGFDPDFSKYSPGTVLQSRVLADLCASQATKIDWGPGAADYKRRLATVRYDQASLYLYPPAIRGAVFHLLRNLSCVVTKTLTAVVNRAGLLSRMKRLLRGKRRAISAVHTATW